MRRKKKSAVVLLNKLLRFNYNPLIAEAVKNYKHVYIVYILDASIYGKPRALRKVNEVRFITRAIYELDATIRQYTESKLFLFTGKTIQNSIGRLLQEDSRINTIYYDGGSSTDDLRIQYLLNRLRKLNVVMYNSEDNLKKTWRRTKSPFRIIEHRKYSSRLASAKTFAQLTRRVEFAHPPPESYDPRRFVPQRQVDGATDVAQFTKTMAEIYGSGFGGRRQGLELLKQNKRVSFQTVYPFLRFGVISPYEFMSSANFGVDDYMRYVYTRRMYETKQLHYARIMDQKISRIYRESVMYRDVKDWDADLKMLLRILRKRGIMTEMQLTSMISKLIKIRKVTWASINSILREYLVGYDVSIAMILIYSLIVPRNTRHKIEQQYDTIHN